MTHPVQPKPPQAPFDSLNLADKAPTALRQVTCPLCHTPSALTAAAVEAGGEWQCVRCGQQWDTTRLAALANYALWLVENNRRVGSQDAGAVSIREDESGHRERDEAVVVH